MERFKDNLVWLFVIGVLASVLYLVPKLVDFINALPPDNYSQSLYINGEESD